MLNQQIYTYRLVPILWKTWLSLCTGLTCAWLHIALQCQSCFFWGAPFRKETVHFQRLYCVPSLHLLSHVKASAINRSFVFLYCRLGRCLKSVHFLLRAAAVLSPPPHTTPPLIIEADRTGPSGSPVYKRGTLFVCVCVMFLDMYLDNMR